MFYRAIIFCVFSLLFSACSNKKVEIIDLSHEYTKEKEKEKITKTEKKTDFVKSVNNKLNKNQNDFIKILENDTYASLCNSKKLFQKFKDTKSNVEKSIILNELFYKYTKNLSNSCIDQKKFFQTLKKEKYKQRNQDYKIYNEKIDKKELISKFNNKNINVEDILKKYTPKHPHFFKLIKELENNKLSKIQKYKVRLNIERLKLLKDYNLNRFVKLNIPSHNFSFYENNKVTRSFGTIVGKIEKQTPVLSSRLTHFIVNPTWGIPDSIAKKSIIPNALKDKTYLKKKNIVIRKNYHLDSKEIKFSEVDWKKYLKKDVKYIPYKFIQLPSRTNGMGRVKFMFPNDYSVYMHDTIGTWRFKSSKEKIRFVSSGCIRLEHPLAFMKHISIKYTPKSYESVRTIYDNEETKTISLSKKLPVHITYLTTSIENGKLKFFKDIYEYDKIQKLNFSL